MRIELNDSSGEVPSSRVLMRVTASIHEYQRKWCSTPIAFVVSFNTYARLRTQVSRQLLVVDSEWPPRLCGVAVHTSGEISDDYMEVL